MPDRPWWALLLDILGSLFTEKKLKDDGAKGEIITTKKEFRQTGYDAVADENRKRAAIVARARSHIGRKYKLGAEIQPGQDEAEYTDCSEEVEDDYRAAGLPMPDGSPAQYAKCQPVKKGKAGDLHFLWSEKWGRIGHVMIDTGEGTVVHALGGVGVCEEPLSKYLSHPRYRGCRRHPEFSRPPEDRV